MHPEVQPVQKPQSQLLNTGMTWSTQLEGLPSDPELLLMLMTEVQQLRRVLRKAHAAQNALKRAVNELLNTRDADQEDRFAVVANYIVHLDRQLDQEAADLHDSDYSPSDDDASTTNDAMEVEDAVDAVCGEVVPIAQE